MRRYDRLITSISLTFSRLKLRRLAGRLFRNEICHPDRAANACRRRPWLLQIKFNITKTKNQKHTKTQCETRRQLKWKIFDLFVRTYSVRATSVRSCAIVTKCCAGRVARGRRTLREWNGAALDWLFYRGFQVTSWLDHRINGIVFSQYVRGMLPQHQPNKYQNSSGGTRMRGNQHRPILV